MLTRPATSDGELRDSAGDLFRCLRFSETVAYSPTWSLPDTTYLERHDCISLLDRPISDADGAADAIRHPIFAPDRDVRPFQSVLLDLGARLKLPGCVDETGAPRYRDFADYIQRHERAPGIGLLAGWRGATGEREGKGPPNPDQIDAYITHGGFWRGEIPESARYYKMSNRDYLQWAQQMGFLGSAEPIVLQLYSETLQKFRLAAQRGEVPEAHRERVATYFDPLPIWYEPFETAQVDTARFPLHAITQRPMFMYHAWGSQNAWLRQIAARNYSTCIRRPAPRTAWPTATGCTSIRITAASRCRRSSPPTCSPTRCGPGTRSANAAAPGSWHPMHPKARKASS